MAKKKRIDGQLALITGAGRGIGLATALELSRGGARIVVAELDEHLAEAGARAVRDAGGDAHGYVLDVTDRDRFDAVVAQIEAGHGPVDILVNNAGVMALGRFLEHGARQDDIQIDVNLRGVMNGMRAVLPRMLERGSGHLVNVASMAGKYGTPNAAVYSATKFGVIGLTEAVRNEHMDRGVGFSYVMPALVDTELIAGAERPVWPPVLTPREVAEAVRRAIEHDKVDVYVPRIGRISTILPVILPRRTQEWLSRKLNVIDMFDRVDRGQRAAYIARTERTDHGPRSKGKNGHRRAHGAPA